MSEERIQVLLVDDEPDIRKLIQMSLERVGNFHVEMFGKGSEALTKLQEWKPDLILIDVMMPEIDGPTLLKKFHEIPDVEKIPFVFLTAKAHKEDLIELEALGPMAVITKPFDPIELPQTLTTMWKQQVK